MPVRRAGHADGNALFDAILAGKSGDHVQRARVRRRLALITHADHKIHLEMPEMLDEIRAARHQSGLTTDEFPDRAVRR